MVELFYKTFINGYSDRSDLPDYSLPYVAGRQHKVSRTIIAVTDGIRNKLHPLTSHLRCHAFYHRFKNGLHLK